MDRLRRMTALQRFGVMLIGTAVANIGRMLFDGLASSSLIALGAVLCFVALGAVELAVHLWHTAQRRLA